MDLREALEDAEGDPAALEALLERVAPEEVKSLERVRALFAGANPPDKATLVAIRRELNKLKYWTNLSSEIRHHVQAGGPCLP